MTGASTSNLFHLGLIGYPLGHSFSPRLHHAALASAGLQGEYRLYPIPPGAEGLSQFHRLVDGLRDGRLQGLNVTIPHKQNVIPFVDGLSDVARAVGAVNTLFFHEGKVIGDNTDVQGFLHDLSALYPGQPGRALVLGAGGSARAVVYALASRGWQVTVLARRETQAKQLVNALQAAQGVSGQINSALLEPDNLGKADFELLVNTTPVGMHPDIHGSPWPDEIPFPAQAAVYDLVYNPVETALVRRARREGLAAKNGAGMLIAQAALAFERWTGREPPFAVMEKAFYEPVHLGGA